MKQLQDFTEDINGNRLQFDGNDAIKSIKQPLPFTEEHIQEIMKCKEDIFYFAENYVKILTLNKGLIVPILRDYQRELINSFINNRFSIVMATRQCVDGQTKITILNKKTNKIEEISFNEFYIRICLSHFAKKNKEKIKKNINKVYERLQKLWKRYFG